MRMNHSVLGAAGGCGRCRRWRRGGRRKTASTFRFLTYRTGPFADSGIADRQWHARLSDMLNERDGGIGGAKINVEECETGYENEKGVECYEPLKGKNPVVINPYSTGITLPLIPKAAVDKIPVLSMAYGLSASAVGNDFPVDVQSARDLLGRRLDVRALRRRQGRRARQAQGQDHRLRPSRCALWQGADPAA